MHALFIPYGKRAEVELLLRDMEAQKHFLRMTKDKKEQGIWIQGQVRVLPFGVYEYIFPKEDLNLVLTTLGFNKPAPYLSKSKIALIRKMVKAKKIPEFETDKTYLWIRDYVSIIPIGIREDGEVTGIMKHDKDWVHEAI